MYVSASFPPEQSHDLYHVFLIKSESDNISFGLTDSEI